MLRDLGCTPDALPTRVVKAELWRIKPGAPTSVPRIQAPVQTKKKKTRRGGGRGFFGFLWGEQGDGREAVTVSCLALGELRTTPSIMNIL